MSIFGSIMSKIFGHGEAAASSAPAEAGAATGSTAPAGAPSSDPQAGAPSTDPQAGAPSTDPQAGAASSSPQAAPSQPVDVEAVLTQMASQHGGGGNWQTSIVDLLKLLGLDSSLNARKELGNELNVHAGADGSAEQNIALHKAVMQKMAENGGKVPESLRS